MTKRRCARSGENGIAASLERFDERGDRLQYTTRRYAPTARGLPVPRSGAARCVEADRVVQALRARCAVSCSACRLGRRRGSGNDALLRRGRLSPAQRTRETSRQENRARRVSALALSSTRDQCATTRWHERRLSCDVELRDVSQQTQRHRDVPRASPLSPLRSRWRDPDPREALVSRHRRHLRARQGQHHPVGGYAMAVEFRYRRLGYVALNVSDLERSARFYRDFVGLAPGGDALHGERLLRCSRRHHDVVLHEGTPGLRRIGWQMESRRDVLQVRAHIEELGIRTMDVAEDEQRALGISDAFRFTEPNTGATLEYFSAFTEAPSSFEPTHTNIARLGHVVLHAANHKATERFFIEELNFRASDRIENAVTFMRCFPNPLHHSFGLGNSNENRLNHVNFMVTDMDDVGRALWRMKKAEVPIVFGPGRHPPSGSVFLYFLDPDGITLEYSFGMEEFPEHDARQPRLLPAGTGSN